MCRYIAIAKFSKISCYFNLNCCLPERLFRSASGGFYKTQVQEMTPTRHIMTP